MPSINFISVAPLPSVRGSHGAFHIDVSDPSSRCKLQPLTDGAVFVLFQRPGLVEDSWNFFGTCVNNGDCDGCGPRKKMDGRQVPFTNGVIRPTPGRDAWWIMDRQDKGWALFGYDYPSLPDLLKVWNVWVGERSKDEHGEYLKFYVEKDELRVFFYLRLFAFICG